MLLPACGLSACLGVCARVLRGRQHSCRDGGGAAKGGEAKDAAPRDAERRKREGHRRTLSPVAHRPPEYGCKVGNSTVSS